MDYDSGCYNFGVRCKQKGLDYAEFIAAFNRAYYNTQYAIDSAKAGYNNS